MLSEARSKIGVVRKGVIYLDNAGAGPLPEDTINAVKNFVEEWFLNGEPWIRGLESVINSKELFAQLIGSDVEEIAATPGLTYGLNIVLTSLRIKRDSNIVVTDINFPTSVYTAHAMKRSGLISEVRIARLYDKHEDIEDHIEKLINDKTSIVLIDHVSWITGYKIDLRRISEKAREKGSYLIVDGFHAAGVLPINVRDLNVDIYLTGTYKWLMSLHGGGFIYVRKDLLKELEIRYSGWFGVRDSPINRLKIFGEEMFKEPFNLEKIDLPDDASKLEWGTHPLIVFTGVEASLKYLIDYKAPESYVYHTKRLVEMIRTGLEEMRCEIVTPENSESSIIVFKTKDPYKVARELEKNNIIVSARPGVIRISPHFYNTEEEVETTLKILKRIDPCE